MERGIVHNTHPGEILKEEIIKANHLTVAKTAELLRVTRPTLSNIVNGKSAITPAMALRIAKVFGGNASLWVRLQMSYDLRKAEKTFEDSHLKLERFSYA
ncbi:MAG: HigA family addiction module antidote protein [Flavobacteriaceae bacterium]|jgi:addiction module HigA family antidote|nr:HigA family addiction module antidote protein [Flavobacteriaceae bacterium]